MICPNCRKDVEPIWEDCGCLETSLAAFCPRCGVPLETEDSYEDYVSDLKPDYRDER